MERPPDLGRLTTREWDMLQELAHRFEEAWRGADTVELAQFLPPPGNPLRPVALHELIKTELEIRWRRGHLVRLEDYLARLPELGGLPTLSPGLIYEEYRVRQIHGDRPPVEAYRDRFPTQYAELQQLLQEQPLPTLSRAAPTPPLHPFQADALPPPATGGPEFLLGGGGFRKLHRIGTGGFGEVWEALAPGDIRVAIKIIFRPLDREEAQRERRALDLIKQLRHPFLLQTQQFWIHDDRLYIVMELADGSLRDRHRECRQQGQAGIPLSDLLRYFHEAAEAIDYLHENHVLHRDIKPDNILLLRGHAKVADFGLARAQLQPTVSVSGSGTPAYMAPEVWRGRASEPSDRYSLALAYTELRLGRRPFASDDYLGVMIEHLEAAPNLASLAEAEQQVLRKALAKDSAQRYASCREFVQALDAALAGELRAGVPTAGPGVPRPTSVPPGPAVETAPEAILQPTSLPGGQQPDGTPSELGDTDVELLPPPLLGPRPVRKRRVLAAVLPLGLAVLVAGGIIGHAMLTFTGGTGSKDGTTNAHDGSFTLEAPPPLTLHPGEAKPIVITIRRDRFSQPVELTFADRPDHVAIEPAVIPAAVEHVEVKVSAGKRAAGGPYRVTVRAAAAGRHEETSLQLRVELLPDLPPSWHRAPGAEVVTVDGKLYYSRLMLSRHGLRVPFILIPRGPKDDLPTFYIMENKVSNDLFRTFAEPNLDPDKTEWHRGGRRNGEDMTNPDGRLPVLRVTVEEAQRFAKWLGGLLPTARQWDKAAGCYRRDRGRGPFHDPPDGNAPPRVAVNRIHEGPMAVGSAADDVSPFGVRDMGGNGREWTRSLAGPLGTFTVPSPKASKEDLVILRGRMYTLTRPLLYSDLDYEQKEPQTQFYHSASPYTGFRVVLEPRVD